MLNQKLFKRFSSTDILGALLCLSMISPQASAAVTDILRETDDLKPTFAVYDIRAGNLSSRDIEEIVLTSVREYASKAKVGHGIPLSPLPEWAPKMELRKVSAYGMDTYEPLCNGEILSVSAKDTSMKEYGEMTMSKACLFSYQGGYRLNYYAAFMQRTGGTNTNVLGAGLGRLFTKAIGLGDSSRFIKSTMEGFEKRFAEAGAEVKLVELFPTMEGKIVMADPAPQAPSSPPSYASSYNAGNDMNSAAGMGMDGMIPPQLQDMLGTAMANNPELMAQLNAARQARMGALQAQFAGPAAAPEDPSLKARKELTAMGLTYHNQDQFIAAVKRGDTLAVKLFVQAEGVDPNAVDRSGKVALDYAKKSEISEILKQKM